MKHCILAKYRAEVYPRREALLPRIREIFAPLAELPGIHGVRVYPNHYVKQRYLPESLGDRTYYEYGPNKTKQAAKRYWDDIKGT